MPVAGAIRGPTRERPRRSVIGILLASVPRVESLPTPADSSERPVGWASGAPPRPCSASSPRVRWRSSSYRRSTRNRRGRARRCSREAFTRCRRCRSSSASSWSADTSCWWPASTRWLNRPSGRAPRARSGSFRRSRRWCSSTTSYRRPSSRTWRATTRRRARRSSRPSRCRTRAPSAGRSRCGPMASSASRPGSWPRCSGAASSSGPPRACSWPTAWSASALRSGRACNRRGS